jgi:hypothetical protein
VSDEWTTTAPVVGPEVDVTYQGQSVDRVSGTVEFPATDSEPEAAVTLDVKDAGHRGSYQGTAKIRIPGQPVLVAPLHHAQVDHNADGTVSGQFTWHGRHHGTYFLTWSLLDTTCSQE